MQPQIAQARTRFRFICRFAHSGTRVGDRETARTPAGDRQLGAPLRTLVGILAVGALLPGCGNVLYAYRANSASMRLEEARQAGAERTALYEYTLAREHLTKAMSEASEADYGDAYTLAQLADGFAEQAFEKARLRMKVTAAPAAAEPQPASASVAASMSITTDSSAKSGSSNTPGTQGQAGDK